MIEKVDGKDQVMKVVAGSLLEQVTSSGWSLVALLQRMDVACPGGDGGAVTRSDTTCGHGFYRGDCPNVVVGPGFLVSKTDERIQWDIQATETHYKTARKEFQTELEAKDHALTCALEMCDKRDETIGKYGKTIDELDTKLRIRDEQIQLYESELGMVREHFGSKAYEEATKP